ncbi:MAG: hypothetical protein HWD82_02995 [Flavobacteriaceae bacterium]|nr:hypothetical protein [Flavobacteriaceae bacterium]
MKTLEKKSWLFTTILLLGITLVSCNSESKKVEQKTLAINVKEQTKTDKVKKTVKEPIVFLTGYDKGNETFYKNASEYFKSKNYKIVNGQYSIEEIINWLNNNTNNEVYGEIHIVNKSNPYNGLSLETLVKGEKLSSETLRRAIVKGELPILNEAVNKKTQIIMHANGLGENEDLLKTIKDAFYADELPNVIASPYYSIFNGEFSKHYLAKPYYVFYPTAHSPGKVDLSKEIAKKYPNEKDISWYDALNNENERYVGEAYFTKVNIPIKFELDYHNSDDELPKFKIAEEVMDFIEQHDELYAQVKKLNIPLEKFRWRWSVKNSTLIIKGSTTCLTVLKPLIKPYGELEHIKPDTNNKRLYETH